MDALFEAYLAAQRRRRRAPLTVKATAYALAALQRWLDAHAIAAAELGLADCERYFDALLARGAVSTARRHLAYVRAAYRYGLCHELAAHDPTAEVRLPRLPDREPATYCNRQLEAIHAAIRTEREELAFHLLAFAGLRLGEVAALAWEQVELEHRQLRLTGKGGKRRLVPLHPALATVLDQERERAHPRQQHVIAAIDRHPLAPPTLGRDVRALVERAGVEIDAPSHAFRRTVATVMYEQGARTRVIEQIMGWAPRTTHERHYLRIADQPMRDAIATLYRDYPICDHQAELPATEPPEPAPVAPAGWLAQEHARLDEIERELGYPTCRPSRASGALAESWRPRSLPRSPSD